MYKYAHIIVWMCSIPVMADVVSLAPDKLDFGAHALGTIGFQETILSNSTKKAVNISSITASGDFTILAQYCGGVLPAGGKCYIDLLFSPTSVGDATGTLAINDDANNTPQKAKLSGIGTPAQVVSITVMPGDAHVPVGLTQQYTAMGTLTTGARVDLTSSAQWSSSSPSHAVVNGAGLMTAVAPGTATISAASGSVTASASLTVIVPVVTSITLSPANFSMGLNVPHQFSVLGTFSDGSTGDVSATAFWSSDSPAIASVDSAGLVSPHQAGAVHISAELPPVAGHAVVQTAAVEVAFLGPMVTSSFSRTFHTATLLANGRVLIAGGTISNGADSSTEIYDPARFQFLARTSMTTARTSHTATLLPDGKVLIAGGQGLASAELYDPSGPFGPVSVSAGSMSSPRARHTATLLGTGQVLIVGGGSATAEIYDPATGLFTQTGSMALPRSGHTATLLNDGRVLIAGGAPSVIAEIFDPGQGAFLAAGTFTTDRVNHTATLMADGRVFLTGGLSGGICTSTVELYDPAMDVSTASASMQKARVYHTATPLSNGQILIAGGLDCSFDPTAAAQSAERFDPTSGTFAGSGDMQVGHSVGFRVGHTATLLLNGQVLLDGGDPPNPFRLGSAELYQPGIPTPPGLQ
jgi:hypothetical protein